MTDRTSSKEKFKPQAIMNGHATFEIVLLRSLSHRNIVLYLDAFVDVRGGLPKASVITEYADLGNLEDYYNNARRERQPFSEVAIWHLPRWLMLWRIFITEFSRRALKTNMSGGRIPIGYRYTTGTSSQSSFGLSPRISHDSLFPKRGL